jgi:hypothetical protein
LNCNDNNLVYFFNPIFALPGRNKISYYK